VTTAHQGHRAGYACGAGHGYSLLACQPAEAAMTSTSCLVPASVTGATTGAKVIFPAQTRCSAPSRKAADAGDAAAMVNLGTLLAEQGEEDQAVQWYRKAADARRRDG
jgi:TPR repeat protein